MFLVLFWNSADYIGNPSGKILNKCWLVHGASGFSLIRLFFFIYWAEPLPYICLCESLTKRGSAWSFFYSSVHHCLLFCSYYTHSHCFEYNETRKSYRFVHKIYVSNYRYFFLRVLSFRLKAYLFWRMYAVYGCWVWKGEIQATKTSRKSNVKITCFLLSHRKSKPSLSGIKRGRLLSWNWWKNSN